MGRREEKIDSMLPAAVAMSGAIIAGSLCIQQGAIINASAAVERKGTSLWGSLLALIGSCLISVGLFIAPMMLLETISISTMSISAILSILVIVIVASSAKSDGDEKSVKGSLGKLGTVGNLMVITIIIGLVFFMAPKIGGEFGLIPETVWRPLLGAIVMVAGLSTASMAIIAGVKSGGEMLIANEGLSIWALLFVALGEGLAIYGLIVAILLIG